MPGHKVKDRKKVCLVFTSALIIKFFLLPHIEALSRQYDVTLILNVDDPAFLDTMTIPATVISVNIQRKVALWHDLKALIQLVWIIRENRFDSVHSISPKGGLLGMLAAWMAGVPVRVHTFQGEVWVNKTGLWRRFLRFLDKVVGRITTHITVVSHSERQFLIDEGIIPAQKAIVLGNGSICGIDTARFHPDRVARDVIRSEFKLGPDEVVILCLGRINRDKGVLDLAQAFCHLAKTTPGVSLLLVGPDEEGLLDSVRQICSDCIDKVRIAGFTPNPERFMAAADVLCLPSYREGFGLVIIEAAATGIPAVCSRIYGIIDAVEEGKTGLLFEVGDIKALGQALARLSTDHGLRSVMGSAAYERALKLYPSHVIVDEMMAFYRRSLD